MRKEAKRYEKEYRNLKAQKSRNKDMPGVEEYVKKKQELATLQKKVKDKKRKIEIAQIALKEKEKKMRRQQAHMMADEMAE